MSRTKPSTKLLSGPTWGPHRISGLVDGVFAIAMTLLVFNLKVPILAENAPAGEMRNQLWKQFPQFLSFGLSLLVLGVYWVAYTIIFQLVVRVDRLYHWVTLIYVLCVITIPFTANLIGLYPYQLDAVLLYGLNVIATSVALFLNVWYAVKFRLINPTTPLPLLRRLKMRIILGIVIYTVATLFAFLDTRISLTVYVLISVIYMVPSRLDRHLAR